MSSACSDCTNLSLDCISYLFTIDHDAFSCFSYHTKPSLFSIVSYFCCIMSPLWYFTCFPCWAPILAFIKNNMTFKSDKYDEWYNKDICTIFGDANDACSSLMMPSLICSSIICFPISSILFGPLCMSCCIIKCCHIHIC